MTNQQIIARTLREHDGVAPVPDEGPLIECICGAWQGHPDFYADHVAGEIARALETGEQNGV